MKKIDMISREKIVEDIVSKLKAEYQPEKIILFGSYASGKAGWDSDIDLLIVKNSNRRRDERDIEVRRLLEGIKFPLDIFVYTSREVKRFYKLEGSFIKKIFDKGKVLYEKQ